MDTLVQVLTLGTAFIIFLAFFRRSIWHGRAPARPTLVEISDSAVARTALIDHADAFSNRPLTLFPVALVTGQRRRRSDSISSAQYGPLWRALRCNLTSEALHPSRFDQLSPLRQESVAALIASLSATARVAGDGGGDVVVVRDSVHAAVFALVARLCFGDLVGDAGQQLAMRRLMQQFVRAIGEANAFAGSWLAKLVHWRQWRRFVVYHGQQAAFFLPLVSERERRRHSGCCNDVGIRPYVDTLIDLRVPDDDDDDDDDAWRALTDDEMVSLLSEFLGASTESVVSCIEWALAHLAAQPEVQEKLRREIAGDRGGEGAVPEERLRTLPYLHAVVLEALRLHPPVPFLMREVHAEPEGAVAGGTTVPAVGGGRTRVHFLIRDMARDRKDWTDPDEFWPERFLANGEAEGVGAVPGPKEIRMMPDKPCPLRSWPLHAKTEPTVTSLVGTTPLNVRII